MSRWILVFLIYLFLTILIGTEQCASILAEQIFRNYSLFVEINSIQSFVLNKYADQKIQILSSLEQESNQQLCIMNTFIVTVGCLAVINTQISLQKSWTNLHEDLNPCMVKCKEDTFSKLPFVREFTNIPAQKYWTIPFSLGEFLLKSEDGHKEEHMNYEWGRYESFKDFPTESPAKPLRLASNGFYYTGNRDTVVCFSCNLQYSDWKESDEPEQLHKLLSPECDFITGVDSGNVPIHSLSESAVDSPDCVTDGAIGGASFTRETYQESFSSEINVQHQSRQGQAANDTGPLPRINHKFPDYEHLHHRMDSFAKWTCADVITPTVLAEAGFFYAGSSDCVRCFSCGGGLRNWEYGDGPWEEHARWFHWCKFLMVQKGAEFIRQYQEINSDSGDETPAEPIVSGEEALKTLEDIKTQQSTACSTNTQRNSNLKNDEEEIKTMQNAEKMLNEMGFSFMFEHIRNTIHRIKLNSQSISIESVIQHLIDNAENPEPSESENVEETNRTDQEFVITENTHRQDVAENNIDTKEDTRKDEDTKTRGDKGTVTEENAKLKNQLLCKICMDSDSSVVFIPCGHMVSCENCAPCIRKCAICRIQIKGRVKAFMS